MRPLPGRCAVYVCDGWACFSGLVPNLAGAPTPALPLLYMAVNLTFNVLILRLMRASSALYVTFAMVRPPLPSLDFRRTW